MDIERLRKLAELNLCKDYYQKYLAMIEPFIKGWLFKPLNEWSNVESYITQMVIYTKASSKMA